MDLSCPSNLKKTLQGHPIYIGGTRCHQIQESKKSGSIQLLNNPTPENLSNYKRIQTKIIKSIKIVQQESLARVLLSTTTFNKS